MTTEGIMNGYLGRSFYIIIANLASSDVNIPKHLEIGEIANAPQEIGI